MLLRHLRIERYRGLEGFDFYPSPGVNALIGPGDAGKTTVLSAISLLLSPNPTPFVSEYDYYRRRVESGFRISAVIAGITPALNRALPHEGCIKGWKDNQFEGLPGEDGAESAVEVRVEASSDMELKYEFIDASGDTTPLTVAARRAFMLAPITTGGRAMAEMRLSRGSLLERHVRGTDLRAT